MISQESELKELLIRRALRVVQMHGKVHSHSLPEASPVRHWEQPIDHCKLHVVVWLKSALEVLITPSSLIRGGGIVYRSHQSSAGGQERFDPDLARLALSVIDRHMVLDDLGNI